MSTNNKTKLQELATPEDRKAIFRMLKEKKTIEQIAIPFEHKGGVDFVLAVLEAGLLPELFENLPKFDLKTHQFSDEEFKKHLSLFKLAIDFKKEGFSLEESKAIAKKNIFHFGELIQSEGIIDKERLDAYFTQLLNCKISTPVVFTEEQRAQLIE